jgi:hypothetical protein
MVFGGMSRTMLEEEIPIPFDIHPVTMRYIPSFQIGVIRCKVGRVRAKKNKIRFWISDGCVTSIEGESASASQIKDIWELLLKIDLRDWTVKGQDGEHDLGAGITWSRIEPDI